MDRAESDVRVNIKGGATREEGGGCQLSCKLKELLIPIQRQPPWSCWLVMNPVSIVQVL